MRFFFYIGQEAYCRFITAMSNDTKWVCNKFQVLYSDDMTSQMRASNSSETRNPTSAAARKQKGDNQRKNIVQKSTEQQPTNVSDKLMDNGLLNEFENVLTPNSLCPNLTEVCDYVRDNFVIKWACEDCTVTLYVKGRQLTSARDHQIIDIDPKKLEKDQNIATCPENVLLLKSLTRENKNSRWLSKVRDLTAIWHKMRYDDRPHFDFNICFNVVNGKTCNDDCLSAHNADEHTVWTIIASCAKNQSGTSFYQALKETRFVDSRPSSHLSEIILDKKRASDEFSHATLASDVKTLTIPDKNDDHSLAFSILKRVDPMVFLRNFEKGEISSASKFNLSNGLLQPIFSGSLDWKDKKILDLGKITPLISSHDFCLACSICYDLMTKMIKYQMPHVCTSDLILVRDKTADPFRRRWEIVRPKAEITTKDRRPVDKICNFSILKNTVCQKGTQCPFAHSEVELDIWQKETATKSAHLPTNFCKILNYCTVVQDCPMIRPFFDFGDCWIWVGCALCVTAVCGCYYTIKAFVHNCMEDMVMFRPITDPTKFWIWVRPRSNSAANVSLCHHILKPSSCLFPEGCQFAHSILESTFWLMEIKKILDTRVVLQRFQRDWLILAPKLNKLRYKDIDSISHLFTDIPPPCPYSLTFICGQCYRNKNGLLSHRSDNIEKQCPRFHDWKNNKIVAVIEESSTGKRKPNHKKVTFIRNLPRQLISRQYSEVKICKFIETSKTCLRSDCSFAHSTIEKEIWCYLLTFLPQKDVEDLAVEFCNLMKHGASISPTKTKQA